MKIGFRPETTVCAPLSPKWKDFSGGDVRRFFLCGSARRRREGSARAWVRISSPPTNIACFTCISYEDLQNRVNSRPSAVFLFLVFFISAHQAQIARPFLGTSAAFNRAQADQSSSHSRLDTMRWSSKENLPGILVSAIPPTASLRACHGLGRENDRKTLADRPIRWQGNSNRDSRLREQPLRERRAKNGIVEERLRWLCDQVSRCLPTSRLLSHPLQGGLRPSHLLRARSLEALGDPE